MKSKFVEVEIKARISDKDSLLETIGKKYRFVREYRKHDTYFLCRTAEGVRNIRIRRDDSGCLITFKRKSVTDGIEVNDEWETGVKDFETARSLLEYLGCEYHYEKTKNGYLHTDGTVSIELSEVNDLGWFLELEYMADRTEQGSIQKGEAAVRVVLADLGISERDIEPRYYADLILNRS